MTTRIPFAWIGRTGVAVAALLGSSCASAQTWTMIAEEGGNFQIASPAKDVRYGDGTRWVSKAVVGAGACTNAFFGKDPAYGVRKRCEVAVLAPAPAPAATAPDMMREWANCKVPEQIIFVRERQPSGAFDVSRYVKYAGGTLQKMAYKNPEGHAGHGPLHVSNCTEGSDPARTQVLSFKLKTTNYFGAYPGDGTGLGDHLPILMRSKFGPPSTVAGPYGASEFIRNPQYHARGIIFHREAGVMGEHYARGQPAPATQTLEPIARGLKTEGTPWNEMGIHSFRARDGVTYAVNVLATDYSVDYQVTGPTTPHIFWAGTTNPGWKETRPGDVVAGPVTLNAPTNGVGLGFAVLCNFGLSGAGCDNPSDSRSFKVEITDIRAGWY
jgi:hypothetical protein